MQTYRRLPVAFERGEGVWLWDTEGKRYLDGLGGIAVSTLGHAHPALTAALAEQARLLLHTSNLYRIPLQDELGARLCEVSQMERVFFGNSGAEANEAAIKLARRYGHERGIDEPGIVVMENAFHGRTMATLTATGNRQAQAGFEPLVSGFRRVPFDDLDAVRQVAEHDPNIVAVLVEPIQGEGGINIPAPGYLQGLREICDSNGWLLMLDEIQSGMGRTGKWFAHQHADIVPDVMTLAKSLGNGIPIGACLARGEAAQVLGPGTHGSTFGGNPFCSRAALTVMSVMEQEGLVDRAVHTGERLLAGLDEAIGDHSQVRVIRGLGLMLAVELDRPCAQVVRLAMDEGLLVNVTAGNVVRLLPPLIFDDEHAELLVSRLGEALARFWSM